MPELEHEIPSQDELASYLREHFAQSMFSPFGTTPEQLSRSFPAELAQAFTSVNRLDGHAFAALAFEAIFAGLRRMNDLPRSHPFWENTNLRPTIYKLPGFYEMELIKDPHDRNALWAAAIIPVWFGRNHFGQDYWLVLSHLPEFDVRWPVYAALTIHLTAQLTDEQLADFLREANASRESVPVLRRLADESEGLSVTWAHRVLQLIEPTEA